MRIEGFGRQWHAGDEAALEEVLRFRDDVGGGLFWLAHDDQDYPTVAIRISGGVADAHYFPDEGHPGFRALAEPPVQPGETAFIYEGCDPATGEQTPNEFVLPVSTAVRLAKAFHLSGTRPSSVAWFDL